jgi:hypothetical protein
MPEYEFTLIIDGEPDFDALYESGCDDATFGEVDGVSYADFARKAPTLVEAVLSAIQAVESVDGLRTLRVEPEDLVTQAEIAERLGVSRQNVNQLVAGERGRGGFPAPVSHLRMRNKLWRWSDVADWAGKITPKQQHNARALAAINGALELRNQAEALPDDDRRAAQNLSRRRRRGLRVRATKTRAAKTRATKTRATKTRAGRDVADHDDHAHRLSA